MLKEKEKPEVVALPGSAWSLKVSILKFNLKNFRSALEAGLTGARKVGSENVSM